MASAFDTVGLIGKYEDPSIGEALGTLGRHLLHKGLRVRLDQVTAQHTGNLGFEVAPRDILGEECELAIVVGGDGTFLNAARTLSDHDIAVLGVNLGRLGFLVDVSPADMLPRVDAILAGRYLQEERLLLHATVEREGTVRPISDALNEVVVHKWQVARMIEFETRIDDVFVHRHRSDGMIVATPTGSTAYALSGGGPILHPGLDALALVPVCPHTLSHRPIVIGARSQIEVTITGGAQARGQITCDGQVHDEIAIGDRVRIRAKERTLRLLHPADYDYFGILRTKLRWSEHP